MPTASERLIWGMGDGSHLPVVETPVGRVGAIICWENYMPALRLAMYGKGIDLWCAPTVDERDIWQSSMRHIAYEGRCFVLSACQYLTRADCPEAVRFACRVPDPTPRSFAAAASSSALWATSWPGPLYGREGVLTADIDLRDTVRGKYDLDVVGHYARPDVFTLTVDERARQPADVRRESLDDTGDPRRPSSVRPMSIGGPFWPPRAWRLQVLQSA